MIDEIIAVDEPFQPSLNIINGTAIEIAPINALKIP